MSQNASADIGLIGLAVMGENLALNIADHGFKVAVYNRTTAIMKKFIARENPPGGLVGCETVKDLVAAVKSPRKFIILVKAGPAIDAVTKELIDAGIDKQDIVVDCGNSLWTDTIRRERDYADKCKFFGSGVSGGELGARFGPSMMPGGDPGFLEASQTHLGSRRRQGRSQDRQTPGKLRPRQTRCRRGARAPPTSAPTARAITSRWSTTESNTSTCN